MNPTKNDIPVERRTAIALLLNERQPELIDVQLQARQAHWSVKAPTSAALHELFDGVAEAIEDFVDTVADRVAASAEGTTSAVAPEIGDADTARLLTGLSREIDMKLWFVEAHLQGQVPQWKRIHSMQVNRANLMGAAR